jgi:hypothetical protein
MHPSEAPASPPVATRHGKCIVPQVAFEPGLNNLMQAASYERDDLNAVAGDHYMQRPGYSAAYQSTDTQFHQPERLLDRQVFRQHCLRLAYNLSGLDFDDMNLPRGVEDRRDSFVPVCKCHFHRSSPAHYSRHIHSKC